MATYRPTVSQLTRGERADFAMIDRRIQERASMFSAFIADLVQVHDRRLYREEWASFAAYCAARCDWSTRHLYRCMAGLQLAEQMGPTGHIENERQARALAAVPESLREQVLAEANADGQPTAALITELCGRAVAGMTGAQQLAMVADEERKVMSARTPSDPRAERMGQICRLLERAHRLAVGHAAPEGLRLIRAAETWFSDQAATA